MEAFTEITTSTMNLGVADILKKAHTDEGKLTDTELQIVDSYIYEMITILHQEYLEYSQGLHLEDWWKLRENGIRRLLWSETPRRVWLNYTVEDFDQAFKDVVTKVMSENPADNYYKNVFRRIPPDGRLEPGA